MKIKKYTNGAWTDLDKPVKKYDTYTDEATTLPLTIETSKTDAVENYRVYGASGGVGEETENLFNPNTVVNGEFATVNGFVENSKYSHSDYISVVSGEKYYLANIVGSSIQVSGVVYDENKQSISNISIPSSYSTSGFFIVPPNGKYIIVNYIRNYSDKNTIMVVKSEVVVSDYIPYGYKIPILNTSGIVSENEFPYAEAGTFALGTGSVVSDGKGNFSISVPTALSSDTYSDYIPLNQTYTIPQSKDTGGDYTFYLGNNEFSTGLFIEFCDSNKIHIEDWQYNSSWRKSTSYVNMTGSTIAYIRFLVRANLTIQITTSPMFSKNSNLTSYVPHFQQSNYDLMLGGSKLYADEYLDYATQKVYKLKEVHKDTVTIDGFVWDILGYDHDEVYDGDGNLAQHSATIQTHDCIANLQFDEREALFAFPSGLSAGTYHFSVTQSLYSGDVGKTMQFTLMNNIPADGVIVLSNTYNVTMIGSTISIYASPSATTAGETATISEGSDGTDLGPVGNAISGNTNSIQRALLGNNNYNQSAIRQFLNADGAAGTYWTPQNKWDRPPSWNASQAGFLNGFSSNFKNAIGTSKKVTALNTVCDGGGTETTNEKVFLLSQTEAYCGGNEGTAYNYYSDYSDLSAAGTEEDGNRIKYQNNVVKSWWTRSVNILHASYGRVISNAGAFVGFTVNNDTTTSPAVCIPLDNINNDPYLQSLFLKPVDPPAPFPTLTTYIGENNLSVDTTVQPEKVAVEYEGWKGIGDVEKYESGEWSDNNGT